MQNKGYYAVQCQRRSFRVIKDSINRKPVCGFLLVINTNRHPISYHFWVIAAYCSNFGHFAFSATLWGASAQRTTFILGSLEHAVDFLLELIELCC